MAVQRLRLEITGIVQGVGFRPFVFRLAETCGLSGWVRNNAQGVTIEAEGEKTTLSEFVRLLRDSPPPLSRIDEVAIHSIPVCGDHTFRILPSSDLGARSALISPDIAVCADCLTEMRDPRDRRFLYPFLNCTNCGPRYTIILTAPYDRPNTTMREFEMCSACRREYEDPRNRRYHAQPTCCVSCGPMVSFVQQGQTSETGQAAILLARSVIADGRILSVKGIGGFHLACDARNSFAVQTLRARKLREEKPFALMAGSLETAYEICALTEEEEQILRSRQRPIVLAQKAHLASLPGIADKSAQFGLMLPYAPLHYLLLEPDDIWVMTSANLSDEPICYQDAECVQRLAGVADAFLTHNRQIYIRCDDSIARVVDGAPQVLRRSRGYAPDPLPLHFDCGRTLCVGAELKNTFCLTRGKQAFLSHHIGDLKNAEEYSAFCEGIDHLCKLLDIEPDRVVCDLHPDYLSTQHAEKLGLPLFRAQHHEAHIASVLMEHGSIGDTVGVAFEGVGWGRDGTLWGGEFFCGSLLEGFRRLGHLAPVPQPGGDLVIKQPWRMTIAHLWSALGMEKALTAAREAFPTLPHRNIETVIHQCASRLNAPETSSVGRLFDAVSAFLGICRNGTYEGQPAAELEGAADPSEQGYYEFTTQGSLLSARSVWEQILADARTASPGACAMRFHRGLAKAVAQVTAHIANASGLDTVILSGGVFQNKTLCELCCAELRLLGLVPLLNRSVPPNDGGICYGQAALLYSLQRGETQRSLDLRQQ